MAIPKPKDMANLNYITSIYQYTHLIQALLSKTELDLIFHCQTILAVRSEHQARKSKLTSSILHQVCHDNADTPHFKRHLEYLRELGTGQWLSAIPNSPSEFADELRLRCKLPLLDTPS